MVLGLPMRQLLLPSPTAASPARSKAVPTTLHTLLQLPKQSTAPGRPPAGDGTEKGWGKAAAWLLLKLELPPEAQAGSKHLPCGVSLAL